jgi:hypothetical protein
VHLPEPTCRPPTEPSHGVSPKAGENRGNRSLRGGNLGESPHGRRGNRTSSVRRAHELAWPRMARLHRYCSTGCLVPTRSGRPTAGARRKSARRGVGRGARGSAETRRSEGALINDCTSDVEAQLISELLAQPGANALDLACGPCGTAFANPSWEKLAAAPPRVVPATPAGSASVPMPGRGAMLRSATLRYASQPIPPSITSSAPVM